MAYCSIGSMYGARRNVEMSLFEQRADRIASVVQVLMVHCRRKRLTHGEAH